MFIYACHFRYMLIHPLWVLFVLKNLITFDGCCAGDSSSPNGVRPQQRHEKHRHNRRYIYMVVQLLQKLTGYADSALKKNPLILLTLWQQRIYQLRSCSCAFTATATVRSRSTHTHTHKNSQPKVQLTSTFFVPKYMSMNMWYHLPPLSFTIVILVMKFTCFAGISDWHLPSQDDFMASP